MTKSSSQWSNASRIKPIGSRSSIPPPHLRLFVPCRSVDFFRRGRKLAFQGKSIFHTLRSSHSIKLYNVFILDAHLSGLSFQNLDVAEAVL